MAPASQLYWAQSELVLCGAAHHLTINHARSNVDMVHGPVTSGQRLVQSLPLRVMSLFAFEMRDPIGNAAAPRTKPRCRSSRAKGADIVVLGEQHLREALLPYMRYCNETRRAADQI